MKNNFNDRLTAKDRLSKNWQKSVDMKLGIMFVLLTAILILVIIYG